MNSFTLNNKLSGNGNFVLEGFPIHQMPESGIIALPVVLEQRIGSEMGLFLIDKTPFIYQIRQTDPFNLQLKAGVVRTDQGPLMYLLFYIPNPAGGEPVVSIDCHVNPHSRNSLVPWRDLSRQSHWHVILVNRNGEEVGLFEFANTFHLGDTLDLTLEACKSLPAGDFNLAKAEFCETYSLSDLLEMN